MIRTAQAAPHDSRPEGSGEPATLLVTGAGGRLGALLLAELSRSGVAARSGSRSPISGQRRLDFDEPATLRFEGVRTLVLISAGAAEDDVVIARHAAAIHAAVRDGVEHLVYTSLATAGDHLPHAVAHRATERLIEASGLRWTFLRNGLYAELFGTLLTWSQGALVSPFGAGALAAPSRADLAAAAAVVAAAPEKHAGRSYELLGTPITAAQVAGRLAVPLLDIDLGTYRAAVAGAAGLKPFQPGMLAGMATAIRHGFLADTSTDLASLLRRPLTDSLAIAADAAEAHRPTR